MSTEQAETMNIIQHLFTMWNTHNPGLVTEIYAANYFGIDMTQRAQVNGPAEVARQFERFLRAFPDLEFQNVETIFDNDRVALYWCARGTHRGTLLNIPPTGRAIQVNGVSMLRFADGKIAQGIHLWDMAGLLREVGLLPELASRVQNDALSWQDAFAVAAR